MARLMRITRGRRWAARLLVLIPVMALVGLAVAVLPAGANHPGGQLTTNGVHPVKLPTTGGGVGGFANCTAAEAYEGLDPGTITALAFTSNPAQASGQQLPITSPEGTRVDGNWYVVLTVASDGRSFAYTVYENGVATQSDGNLEAPRKQPNKTENLSHVTLCFVQANGSWVAAFVEVKGSEGTNHYMNVANLDCGDTVIATDGDVSGTFTRLENRDSSTCEPKLAVLFASDAGNEVGFFPEGDQSATYLGVVTFNPETSANPPTHAIEYDPDGDGTFQDMKWCASVTYDAQGNVTGGSMPAGESWCIIDLYVEIYSSSETQPTWTILGFDDPLIRGR